MAWLLLIIYSNAVESLGIREVDLVEGARLFTFGRVEECYERRNQILPNARAGGWDDRRRKRWDGGGKTRVLQPWSDSSIST